MYNTLQAPQAGPHTLRSGIALTRPSGLSSPSQRSLGALAHCHSNIGDIIAVIGVHDAEPCDKHGVAAPRSDAARLHGGPGAGFGPLAARLSAPGAAALP
jgi:hypothetical protein